MRRTPSINKGIKILVICEGYEEFDYFNKLKECKVWSSAFNIKTKNAKSIDKIAAIYQNEYQNDSYDLVVVFCDTEMAPYEKFGTLCKALNDFHGKNVANKLIIFANPCTMQIILAHFNKISLSSNSKTQNSALIEKLTGVKNYDAEENQRKAVMSHINSTNYSTMKNNLRDMSVDCAITPSTNAISWFELFEHDGVKWIKELNNNL